jgi:hypothetical protein
VRAIGRTLDYISSIQNSEVVFDYMELPAASSEESRQLDTERTERLKKLDERSISRFEPASVAAILRSRGFSAVKDINSKRSRHGSAAAFTDSRPDTLVFMLSTRSPN